jgi:hypothetical protein
MVLLKRALPDAGSGRRWPGHGVPMRWKTAERFSGGRKRKSISYI